VTNKTFFGFFLMLFAVAILFCPKVPSQTPTPASAGDQGEGKGIKVKDGDTIEGHTREKAEASKTQVRFKDFCDALDKAAQQTDVKKKKFKNGPVEFWGHEPWIAKLVCGYVDGAAGDAKDPGRFGFRRSDAELKTAKEKLPAEYEARRQFLAHVLDEFANHSGQNWKTESWIPSTALFSRERILVGNKILANLDVSPDQPEKLNPKPIKRFTARSVQAPDSFLFAQMADDFFGPTKSRELENKGQPLGGGVIAWLLAAEQFLLRAHAMTVGGALSNETNTDFPNLKMAADISQYSLKFKDKYLLRNCGPYTSKEAEKQTDEKQEPKRDLDKIKADARKDFRFVDLAIDDTRTQIPAKNARSANVPGISLFVYRAINGPERGEFNPRSWFLKYLAEGRGDVDPGGITLPMWTFRKRGPQAVTFADRLFDETTKVPVETRFETTAVCVARIFYYTHPAQRGTQLVSDHELRHFNGIRDAWALATNELQTSLRTLATTLNDGLGNPQGAEAFIFDSREFRDVWRIDPNNPELTSIPEGPVRPATGDKDLDNRLYPLHTNRKVSYLRMSIVRTLPAESATQTLLEAWESGGKNQIDSSFDTIKDWESAHWKDDKSNEFKNSFARRFLLAALTLDRDEGVIDSNGQQSGDASMAAAIRIFEQRLKDSPRADPLDLVPKKNIK
jgi:hypothetical protein